MFSFFYPALKDFDKPVDDLLKDDFDLKYSFKLKTVGPCGTHLVSTTQYNNVTRQLVPKLSIKGKHPSGFSLDKLETTADRKLTFEGSFPEISPGFKVEFKGNDTDKADVGLSYRHPYATSTLDVDILKFNYAKFTIHGGGNGPLTLGGSANVYMNSSSIKRASSMDNVILGVGVGYTIPRQCFIGLRSEENFQLHSMRFKYFLTPQVTIAGKLFQRANGMTSATVVGVMRADPKTLVKVRVDSEMSVGVSVKRDVEKNLSVIGVMEIPKTQLTSTKFGVSINLG